MSVDFEQARQVLVRAAAAEGDDRPVAAWGWENDTVFVLAFDYGPDGREPLGEETPVVDKATGRLRWEFSERGEPVAPNLRPIGAVPA